MSLSWELPAEGVIANAKRRARIVQVDERMILIALGQWRDYVEGGGRCRLPIVDLPANAEIVGGTYNFACGTWDMVVTCPDWEPAPEGSELPYHRVDVVTVFAKDVEVGERRREAGL